MENILDKIVANKRKEVEIQKSQMSIDRMVQIITDSSSLKRPQSFKQSLADSATGIIAEFKRKSPSKGFIFEHAKVDDVIPVYSDAGASAISVLTDELFFGGTFEDLRLARSLTVTPLLRKDFMIDEYQLFQAAMLGADAILLIASCLTVDDTKKMAARSKELGLDVLLEIHNEKELGHINDYVDVVGINNRNLGTFQTDVQVSFDLGEKIPSQFLKISESGISDILTVKNLRQAGFRGFLMGENFMKTNNPGLALERFINELKQ